MRSIQVCTSKGQFRGGAEQFCLNLSKSLALSGHDVILVTGDRRTPITRGLQFNVETIPEIKSTVARKLGYDYINPNAVRSFRSIIENLKPDVVHFHSFYGLSSSLVKVASANCPVLITLHDSWLAYVDVGISTPRFGLANSYYKVPHGFIHRLINKHLLKDANLVSPSLWMKKFFETAGFQAPTYIPNGVELVNSSTTYQKLLIWVGNLTTFKGLPTVIGILSEFSVQFDWKFVVIGDGPHKQELELLYSNIQFVGYTDPEPYFQEASILIVSSIGYDNFPTVILEGMRRGLCVIGHDLGGIAELIHNNTTGILYKSVNSLADILPLLMNNPKRIREIGSAARSVFEQKYHWQICLHRYLELYKKIISSRSTPIT